MSVMGFKKKKSLGGVRSIQVFLGFLEFFNFAKPLREIDDILFWEQFNWIPEINMTVTECALIDFLLTRTVATCHGSCIHPF